MATIKWKGDEVRRKMAAAAALGIDQTMSECVHDAASDHPAFPPASEPYERYANRTGATTGAIRMERAATVEGTKVSGAWGAYMRDALFLEVGTSRMGPTVEERVDAADGNMDAIAPPEPPEGVTVAQDFTVFPVGDDEWRTAHRPSTGTGPRMAPRPFLRPAADRNYPKLAAHIAAAFRSE